MGKISHAKAEGFSADLNAYLKYVVNGHGHEDRSGRWLTEVTGNARARDYWGKLIKNERAMTTNDIDVLAGAFGMTPFDFVRAAQDLANGGAPPVPDVAPHPEDYHISDDPGDEYGLAAETPRGP